MNKKKKKIIERSNMKNFLLCQSCNIKQENCYRELDVHHIDYSKQNCKKDNLISLCSGCNIRVNFNRDYWYAYFTYIMENY